MPRSLPEPNRGSDPLGQERNPGRPHLDAIALNTLVVRAHFDAFNRHELSGVGGLVADDFVGLAVATGEIYRGRAGYLRRLENWNRALPDGQLEVLSLTAAGDRVAVEYVGRGTHGGPFATQGGEIPASGRPFEARACEVFDLRSGLITGIRLYFDTATLMRQFGLLS